jgi:hypothetical protein
MIQCKDCEFYAEDSQGRRTFNCDPFKNIKEPECLTKWQLLRLDMLIGAYRGMLGFQEKLAPMQDKLLRYVKRELEDLDESENWKADGDQEPESFF